MDLATDYLWRNPPKCIEAFLVATPEPDRRQEAQGYTKFALKCRCGSACGSVLGYPLKSLKQDYSGPAIFVGPLAFRCSNCDLITEVINSDVHGYHAALGEYVGEVSRPVTV